MKKETMPAQAEEAEEVAAENAAGAEEKAEMPAPPNAEAGDGRAAIFHLLSRLSEQDKGLLLAILRRLQEFEAARQAQNALAEQQACLSAMAKEPAFLDVGSRAAAMEDLIRRFAWLRALPVRDRLAAAYYLDRGMNTHTPTQEEKLSALLSDPALLRALAERQAKARAAMQAEVPPAGPGLGLAPATVARPPRSLKEAKAEAKRRLRA